MAGMNIQQKVGLRARALREARGLRRNDFAYTMGISLSNLHGIEVGAVRANDETLQRIADGLGVTLAEFFDDDVFHEPGPDASKMAPAEPLPNGVGTVAWLLEMDTADRAVISVIAANPDATVASMAKMTGFGQTKVKAILSRLKAEGRVRRVGSRKAGRWEVVDGGGRAWAAPHGDTL